MSKDKYKVTNWSEYNEGLKQRGSVTLWINSEVSDQWTYKGNIKRGGQKKYSDMAIEICLIVRKVYHLPLRQTEGFMKSFFKRSNIHLNAPDYTTISKRSGGLSVDLQTVKRGAVTDIVADSTGLKVYGEGE